MAPGSVPGWVTKILVLAGLYNLLWGAWVVLFPSHWFDVLGIQVPLYPELWQCIGMVVGCYGVGYLIAAIDPIRFWPLVFVGLLGKIAGPIGFAWALYQGTLPLEFGWMILFNDLIWWGPFAGILVIAARSGLGDLGKTPPESDRLLSDFQTNRGHSLEDLSFESPVLLIFLRHTGCTFCRETLYDLKKLLPELKKKKVQPVLVHMSATESFQSLLDRIGIKELEHVSDPEKECYRLFKLKRGTLGQLFSPEVWRAGIAAFFGKKLGVGALEGDGFQMPGAFLIEHGEVTVSHEARHAGDHPDYLKMADQATVR